MDFVNPSPLLDSQVREKLAATFGGGQSATKTKHLHTRIVLLWRAYAKGKVDPFSFFNFFFSVPWSSSLFSPTEWGGGPCGKVERKKLYHVANAIYSRSVKTRVFNAWVSYFTVRMMHVSGRLTNVVASGLYSSAKQPASLGRASVALSLIHLFIARWMCHSLLSVCAVGRGTRGIRSAPGPKSC